MNTLILAAKVLAKASTYDNRQARGETDVERKEAQRLTVTTWAEALDADVTESDALAAVTEHYAQTRDWMMPSDVNRRCRAMRRARLTEEEQRHGQLEPEGVDDASQWLAWKRQAKRLISQGATRQQAENAAYEHIGMTPPPPAITEHHTVNTNQIGARA